MSRNWGSTWVLVVGLWLSLGIWGCSSDSGVSPSDVKVDTTPDVVVGDMESDTAMDVPLEDLEADWVPDVSADVDEDQAPDVEPDTRVEPGEDPGVRMRAAGWMAGDLHMHTTHSDGDDSVAIVIALAEYLDDPVFLAANPGYEGNPLNFISITDHRTVSQQSDPDYHSDRLVLVGGEEYGGPGHAGIWGITQHIPHGGSHEEYRAGVDAAHAAGGLFCMNHPFTEGLTFPWDVRTHDALEVVNTRWALMGPAVTPEFVTEWEQGRGPASPFFKKATQYSGMGGNQQALLFYEAKLTLGIHVALVGGSDRHVLFPVGFPTTWVRGEANDEQGVLEGIRRRHTFVSRTPVSATVEMEVDNGTGTWEMGDAVPVAQEGQDVTLTVRVGRAQGGLLRLIRGYRVDSDEELADAELGEVAHEESISGNDVTFTVTTTVLPGDWIYPLVLEPLVPEGLAQEYAEFAPAMAAAAAQRKDDRDYGPILDAVWNYIDLEVLLSPQSCDPATWNPLHLQCMPPDTNGVATYFLPDWIDRALNVRMENNEATQWAMGSVGSAVVFAPDPD